MMRLLRPSPTQGSYPPAGWPRGLLLLTPRLTLITA